MANKAKIKGSAYEAKIALLLTKELKLEFKRVPLSGSLSWLKGDLIPIDDTAAFPYCIECKHYAEVDWNNLLTAKTSTILGFWEQTLREAKVMKKRPLLIYRWNRSKDYVCWDSDIELESQISYRGFNHSFKMGLLSDWIKEYKTINNIK